MQRVSTGSPSPTSRSTGCPGYIITRTDLTVAQVVACANQRCNQEKIIGQLKSGVNALRVPLYDLVSN